MNSLKKCSDRRMTPAGSGQSLSKRTGLFFLSILSFLILAQSCSRSKEEMEYREASAIIADSVSRYMADLATDTIDGIARHFIRNASLKCKMQNVLSATKQIEDLVSLNGGFASGSNLVSEVSSQHMVRSAKDSMTEQTRYITTNHMTLRVPNKQLDTVLRKITDMAVFVDYRTLRSDDVKMKLFANSLAERRFRKYNARVENKASAKEAKLNHAVAAEENILDKQAQADKTRIETYELADQVNYSTLVIDLYETQKTLCQATLIPPVIEPYEPSFAEKFGDAFLTGFQILKNFILFLTANWSVFLIIAAIVVSVRKAVQFYTKREAMRAPQKAE